MIRAFILRHPWIAVAVALVLGVAIGGLLPLALEPETPPPVSEKPAPPPTQSLATLAPVGFEQLAGWNDDALEEARPALERSCGRIAKTADAEIGTGPAARPAGAWKTACASVLAAGNDRNALRAAFEAAFVPHQVSAAAGDTGTFTGYYEATLNGSLTPDERFRFPLYAPPSDLITVALKDFVPNFTPGAVPATIVGRVEGRAFKPYAARAEIDSDGFRDRAEVVAWVDDPVAAHILHIQGSGQIVLPDGTIQRVGFAAHNGRQFTGLGRILIDEGVLSASGVSMIAVRDWLQKNPDRAKALMDKNARYIFFRRIDGDGPIGAEGVALTPLRSLAVDPRAIPLGAPMWLDVADPDGVPLKRLMMAQDVGAAITGAIRGDIFWGAGDAAFAKAARMNAKGRYFVLLPKT